MGAKGEVMRCVEVVNVLEDGTQAGKVVSGVEKSLLVCCQEIKVRKRTLNLFKNLLGRRSGRCLVPSSFVSLLKDKKMPGGLRNGV